MKTTICNTITFVLFLLSLLPNNLSAQEKRWNATQHSRHQLAAQVANTSKPGDMRQPFGNLLSTAFENIEIALGKEYGTYNYWNLRNFSEEATLVRIGNVPGFTRNWEIAWNLQTSWSKTPKRPAGDENIEVGGGLMPLLVDGSFALMFNPGISDRGGLFSFRLLTNVGVEAGAYLPEFHIAHIEETLGNVGKTTGVGPQLGAGFALSTGFITLYSINTISRGKVLRSSDHNYTSLTATAGLRVGQLVNVRYAVGERNWADSGKKNVRFSRVTLGLTI